MGKDYYSILGVSKDVDEAALKAAYKKAALKHHPDRNRENQEAASKKFKEAAEAFEVLSDKNKRAIYDQFGEEGLKGAGPGGAGGPPPGFGGMGGGMGGFPSGGFTFSSSSGGAGFQPMDPNDLFAKVFAMNSGGAGGGGFSGLESLLGGNVGGGSRRGGGNPFSGGGMSDDFFGGGSSMPGSFGSHPTNGHSHQTPDDNGPEDVIRPLQLTLEELYKGVTKKLKVTRKLRDGRQVEKTCEVNVKPGWKAGTKVKFPATGNEDSHGRAAAMVFEVTEKPHSRFTREGDDLIYNYQISLVEALTGSSPTNSNVSTKRTLKHLDDRTIQFNLPLPNSNGGQPIKPGQEIVIPNEGMPITRKGSLKSKGDLRIRIQIEFPNRLSSTQVEALKRILGGSL
ncbi:hypothetical protein CROQUDRAFT_652336 [Cronartium quercuum f. sp. fusiforme G11]|uniref:J domain-containing protein n=1 Tax=Cronartium quercuum f. sp. fusiforme G11 TaxID=708437 RepID=A0A9P6TFA3_9BASI|nr:hypothetical protein CROQUDRAFT_652336 [Cronartium quercuum f. sp. fusiforme G11]